MNPRDQWLASPEGQRIRRESQLHTAILQTLFMGPEAPMDRGKTIGQVYKELAAAHDYDLTEICHAFEELERTEQIFMVNDKEPLISYSTAEWRPLQ